MTKNIALFLVCIMLVSSFIVVISPVESVNVNGNTLYVGGTGPGNYTRIQDAIDNATSGDTVFVYNGTYYEDIIIYKPIKLIGEDRNSTIIKSLSDIISVHISVDKVTFHGFTVNNSHIQNQIGGGALFITSNSNSISDNYIVDNNWIGIYINGSLNIISRNIISNNFHSGIHIVSGDSNLILNNTVIGNQNGIYISSFCNNITVSGNFVLRNIQDGINVIVSKGHTITNNIISGNNYSGIYLREVFYTSIESNILSYNNRGIFLHSSLNNNVEKNFITNNFEGIYLWVSHFNIFYRNTITNSNEVFTISFSRCNTIKYNNIINNSNEPYFVNSFGCWWNENYWDSNMEKIKIIHGFYVPLLINIPIPVFAIDWHPAIEPYNIPPLEVP